ncbi:hypothetical protein K438DRAFT_1983753 [Mycena galopus ATCC 62051]|nr:hypothetical protein K438DRAFT_1983753 [Mycena galopus ATCC 62051]
MRTTLGSFGTRNEAHLWSILGSGSEGEVEQQKGDFGPGPPRYYILPLAIADGFLLSSHLVLRISPQASSHLPIDRNSLKPAQRHLRLHAIPMCPHPFDHLAIYLAHAAYRYTPPSFPFPSLTAQHLLTVPALILRLPPPTRVRLISDLTPLCLVLGAPAAATSSSTTDIARILLHREAYLTREP